MQSPGLTALLLASIFALVQCNLIFVADYSGKIVTLDFHSTDKNITLVDSLDVGQASQPSWLFRGQNKTKLWATFETGHIRRFDAATNGSLRADLEFNIQGAPVHADFVFNNSAIAVANYGGPSGSDTPGGVSLLNVDNLAGRSTDVQKFSFPKLKNTTTNSRQDVARAHGVAADPHGNFFVVADFGADKMSRSVY